MLGSQERPGSLVIFLSLTTILISISSASILVILSGAPSYACAFWRMLISTGIASASIIVSRKSLRYLRRPDVLVAIIVSGTSLGLHFLLWMESLFLVPVAVSVTLVTTYPFFNLIVDVLVFREKVTGRQVAYLVLGFILLVVFINPRVSDVNLYGSLLALGGALAASLYFSIGRYLRPRLDLSEYVTPVYLIATLTILIYSLATKGNLLNYSPRTYLFFLLLAVVPMMGGHTLMNYLLKFMKSSVVTSIALGEPIGASLLAYIFLGQKVSLQQALLMALVIICLIGVVYEEGKAECSPA